jgi:hypothetical protein
MHESYARAAAEREERYLQLTNVAENHQLHVDQIQLHVQTHGDMLIKYFAEKVNPGLYVLSAKKEGFAAWHGAWREACLKHQVDEARQLSEQDRAQLQRRHEELQQLLSQEHAVRDKAHGDILIKYFSDRVSPAVHDNAAQKEAFDMW